MAAVIARFTTFVPATPILSNDMNSELNALVNVLAGSSTTIKAVFKVSDAGDPPLELNQLSTGPIQKWFQAGVEKARTRNDGSFRFPGIYDTNDNEELLFVATASAVNEFTMANAATGNPPELRATGGNADISIKLVPKGTGVVQIQAGAPVAGGDAANKTYVDGKKISFSIGFSINDPSTANLNSRDFGSFIVPNGGTYTFTQGKVMFREGSHTAGGSLTFKIDQSGVGDKSTLTLDNTNNTPGTVYPDNFGDFTATENNIFSCYISARSGTITEKNVMVVLEGFRTPF